MIQSNGHFLVSFTAPISRQVGVPKTVVFAEDTIEEVAAPAASSGVERGVSIDQDGKSNVWAIEPKMEVSTKSNEEKTSSALIAGGGLAAFAVGKSMMSIQVKKGELRLAPSFFSDIRCSHQGIVKSSIKPGLSRSSIENDLATLSISRPFSCERK